MRKCRLQIPGFIIAHAIALLLMSCQGTENQYITQIPEASPSGAATPEYVFQAGDRFQVKFFEYPELDVNLVIRPDGRISMSLLEDTLVAGMTPSELDRRITEAYRKKIRDPEVSIIVSEFAGQRVWVAGEVFNPGSMELKGRMTALQSIFGAGGPRKSAKLENIIIIRRDDIKRQTLVYMMDIEKRLDGEEQEDFVLQPYDVVYVPKTAIAKIGEFIDQYINDVTPNFFRMGINFTYPLKDAREVEVVND